MSEYYYVVNLGLDGQYYTVEQHGPNGVVLTFDMNKEQTEEFENISLAYDNQVENLCWRVMQDAEG